MTFAHMGMKLRLLGKKDMQEFMRVASLPARDLMDEYFEDDTSKRHSELGRTDRFENGAPLAQQRCTGDAVSHVWPARGV